MFTMASPIYAKSMLTAWYQHINCALAKPSHDRLRRTSRPDHWSDRNRSLRNAGAAPAREVQSIPEARTAPDFAVSGVPLNQTCTQHGIECGLAEALEFSLLKSITPLGRIHAVVHRGSLGCVVTSPCSVKTTGDDREVCGDLTHAAGCWRVNI